MSAGSFAAAPTAAGFRSWPAGTRGTDGLAFDRRWNLFSNDNDHESLAERYSPARLLHVAPSANFFWPRGWIASMSPDRSDLLETMTNEHGARSAGRSGLLRRTAVGSRSIATACWWPVGDSARLPAIRWRRAARAFRRGKLPFLAGTENARPVGVAVGRGGRVFATISYMPGNEGSPKYPSELVMITRADDPARCPFEPYDAPRVEPARLWRELSQASTSRRHQAHNEILRRGGELLVDATRRLKTTAATDPALAHLPWLAAASGTAEAREALLALLGHKDPELRATAVRALAEFPQLAAPSEVFAKAMTDKNPAVVHSAVTALASRSEPLPDALFAGPACSQDTYLRQAATFLLAQRASAAELDEQLASPDAARRLAGVLAAGFRLTVPPAIGEIPAQLPLRYESGNAFFTIQYADATVDLKKLGRVGSFTTAERWKTIEPTADERHLFEALLARLDDSDDRVALQAGYFLSLLDDARANDLVAHAQQRTTLRRLSAAPVARVTRVWQIGPFDDGEAGMNTVHAPQSGPIDLTASVVEGPAKHEWLTVDSEDRFELAPAAMGHAASSYFYFRLQSLQPRQMLLKVAAPAAVLLWHNGRAVEPAGQSMVLTLEPGSNDILLRVAHTKSVAAVSLEFQTPGRVEATLPETLEQRHVGRTAEASRRQRERRDRRGICQRRLDRRGRGGQCRARPAVVFGRRAGLREMPCNLAESERRRRSVTGRSSAALHRRAVGRVDPAAEQGGRARLRHRLRSSPPTAGR